MTVLTVMINGRLDYIHPVGEFHAKNGGQIVRAERVPNYHNINKMESTQKLLSRNLSVVPLATGQEEGGQTGGLSQAVQRFEGSGNEL